MAKQPKIRFKGFTEEWKEKGFSELVTIRRGLTYSPESIVSEDGIVVLRSSNISDGQFRTYKDDVRVRNEVVHIPLVEDGDILITAANGSKDLVGKHAVIHNLQEPSVPGGFMLLASGKETTFVNALMGSSWYSHFIGLSTCGGGGSIGNLNKSDLESQIVYIPNDKAERDIIAKYFDSLDSTITSRETELEKLKNIKRSLLEKLFPQDGQAIPAIRFKGFEGKWENRRLKDIATRVTRKNIGLESTLPLCISAQLGLVSQTEYYNNVVVGANLANYFLIKKGEFAYNKSAAGEYPMGAVKCLKSLDKGILSTLYIVFALKDDIDADYVQAHYETKPWQDDVKKRVAVGARNHGLLNISPEDFFDSLVVIPHNNDEQKKVGQILAKLSQTISLRERQLTLLKHSKQALLEQMFVNE